MSFWTLSAELMEDLKMLKYSLLLMILFSGLLYAENAESYLQKGEKYFEEALELAMKDEGKSKELYRKSAMNYELYLAKTSTRNGEIYYNLGNAYYFADEYGLALLNYRKAELYMPYDRKLQQNISQVREKRYDDVSSNLKKRLSVFIIWHTHVSTSIRIAVLAVILLIFWGLMLHQLYKRRNHSFPLAVLAIPAFILIYSISIDIFNFKEPTQGVITQQEVTARKGNSYIYEPAFDSNLHGGTEFKVIEKRGEWYLVELENDELCWLPENSVGLVE